MQIAGMKPVSNPATGMVQPLASRGFVQVAGAVRSEIVFGRTQVAPIGGGLWTGGIDLDQSLRKGIPPSVGQELPDDHFRPLVVTLAESMVTNTTLHVGEIEGGPVIVGERAPDLVGVVHGNRVTDAHVLSRAPDVVELLLELELGCVD